MRSHVYLDANILIAMLEHDDERAALLLSLLTLEFSTQEATPFATSRLTLAECLVRPMRRGDLELADGYKQWIDSPAIRTVEVDQAVLVGAAGFRARHLNLKLPDAIHLASAKAAGCGKLLTDDRRLTVIAADVPVVLRPEPETLHSLIAEFST